MTDGCKASGASAARKLETRTGQPGRSCPELTISGPILRGRGQTRPVEARLPPVSRRVAAPACKASFLPVPAWRWTA